MMRFAHIRSVVSTTTQPFVFWLLRTFRSHWWLPYHSFNTLSAWLRFSKMYIVSPSR